MSGRFFELVNDPDLVLIWLVIFDLSLQFEGLVALFLAWMVLHVILPLPGATVGAS